LFLVLRTNKLFRFVGTNNFPIVIRDLENNVYNIENDDQLIEIVYDLLLRYQNYKDFNLEDFFNYLNVKINFDMRTIDLIKYYDFNKTNPIPIDSMPSILFEVISFINSQIG
jgi:hypothetical protein